MRFLSTIEDPSNNSSSDQDRRVNIVIITVCVGIIIILITILIVIILSKKKKTSGSGLSSFNELVINNEMKHVNNLVQRKQDTSKIIKIDSELIEIKKDCSKLGLNEVYQGNKKGVSLIKNINEQHEKDEDDNPSSKNIFNLEKEIISKFNSKKSNQIVKGNSKKRTFNMDNNTRDEISYKPSSKNINQDLNKLLSKGLQKLEIVNSKIVATNSDLFNSVAK